MNTRLASRAVLAVFSIATIAIPIRAGGPPERVRGNADRLAKGAPPTLEYAPGQVLVRFREGAAAADQASVHALVGAAAIEPLAGVDDLYRVRMPKGTAVKDAVALYSQQPDVLYAEPNWIVKVMATPDDPSFGSLWGLHNTGQSLGTPDADIDAPEAWDLTTGGSDAVVAIIDTGVDYNHPDLSANMFRNSADCNADGVDDDGNGFVDDCYGYNAISNSSDPLDDHDHGTHVAGTVGAAGNNSTGVVGVGWTARIMACKFLSSVGSGTLADAVECLNYVALMKDRGVNIVATSNSWGGGGYSQALYDAIEAQRQRGILFIAAAGNSAQDTGVAPAYPAAYYLPNILSVAATTRTDALAYYSNYGKRTAHLGAPGSEVLSTTRSNTYSTFSGTSMATPHVTGVAALLKAQDPTRDWRAIRNLLLAGGDDTPAMASTTVTGKRLNAYGALTCAGSIVASRLRPLATQLKGTIGTAIDLAALHLDCAEPNGDVNVTVEPGGGLVTLVDDGLAPDQGAGDGIYSGRWAPTADGTYTLTFPGQDLVVVEVGKPDLLETSVDDPPATTSAGATFSVTDTTSNSGAIAAVGSYTRYYLSTDTLWSATDKLLTGSRYIASLAAGASSVGTAAVTVPPIPVGAYYLLACADDTRVVAEVNETNNCTTSSGTVQILLPDLLVSAVGNPPATVPTGGTFSATDTTSNSGPGTAAASATSYYLSTDAVWSTADRLLTGTRSVPGLAVGASSGGSATVTVPANTPAGSYYLIACADGGKVVAESNELNNCSASAGTVQVLVPDLLVSSLSSPPVAASPGGSFLVTDTTSNSGVGAAGGSNTRYYLSTDALWSATDRLLVGYPGNRYIASLAGGASSTGTVNVTVPTTMPGGAYYLLGCADDYKRVAESNETNNCAPSAGTVQILLADLVASSVNSPPATAAPGGSFWVADTTTNSGTGTSGISYTRYYLSTDVIWSATDRPLGGSRIVANLLAGASSAGTTIVAVSTAMPAGAYYLLACADDTKVVVESNETNNCAAAPGLIQVGWPDLVGTSVSDPPATALPGDTFNVTDTVVSQGIADAGASTTRYYLSHDAVLGAGDILLSGSRAVGSLAAGASSMGTATVIIPATTAAGTYTLLACADDLKAVTEGNETNNCGAAAAAVAVQAPGSGGACVGTGSLSISGKIEGDGGGIPGIAVALAGPGGCTSTTLTAADGSFVLADLGDGGYTVTPSKGGCTFTPPSLTLQLFEDTDLEFVSNPSCF